MPEVSETQPTKRLVELIETTCPAKEWEDLAKQLSVQEVKWIADTCDLDLEAERIKSALTEREGDNWDYFIEAAFGDTSVLQKATKNLLSKYSQKILEVETFARDSNEEYLEDPVVNFEKAQENALILEERRNQVIANLALVAGEDAQEVYDNICQKLLDVDSQLQKPMEQEQQLTSPVFEVVYEDSLKLSQPTERLVEVIEVFCPTEQWGELAKQLNAQEVQWIADTCGFDLAEADMLSVLTQREGAEWDTFIELAFTENFDSLQDATSESLSKYGLAIQEFETLNTRNDAPAHNNFLDELDKIAGSYTQEVYETLLEKVSRLDAVYDQVSEIESQAKNPAQREEWENKMLSRAFENLREVVSDAEGNRTVEVGKYEISWDRSAQVLKISDDKRGTLYEAVRGEVATVSNFSQAEKDAFAKIQAVERPQPAQEPIQEPVQREGWESNMLMRAFEKLREVTPDAKGNRTAEVGKYKIDWDKSAQTLKVSSGERGTLYEAVRGQAATISNFSQKEKEAFGKVQTSTKGVEHGE